MAKTQQLLEQAEWGLDGYHSEARLYRLESSRFPSFSAKIFNEKDIPIQVAVGNYDLGICGLDWIEELLSKYPSSALAKVKNLGYGQGALFAAVSAASDINALEDLSDKTEKIRIASEYPNIAESLAARLRLKRFSVFPLWGAAEAYPPDSADLVLMPRKTEEEIEARGLRSLGEVLGFKAYLIANRESLRKKDMAQAIASILENYPSLKDEPVEKAEGKKAKPEPPMPLEDVRLALPDGHQQRHVRRILDAAGIQINDYPSSTGVRRPQSNLEGVAIKVIRPQDMPLQVANGNFDLAITGRDWLTEHRHQFPTSPVEELLDLKYGWVRVVAVVNNDVAAEEAADLKTVFKGRSVRVASEYVNIADHYARVNHLGDYRIIPTWGATEAFIPEDADLLIENTETGGTIRRHNLKIVDTLFESTACLVANATSAASPEKGERMRNIARLLDKAVKEEKD